MYFKNKKEIVNVFFILCCRYVVYKFEKIGIIRELYCYLLKKNFIFI